MTHQLPIDDSRLGARLASQPPRESRGIPIVRLHLVVLAALLALAACWALADRDDNYSMTTLASDMANKGTFDVPNLQNAWGLAFANNGLLWVAENHSGAVSLFMPDGNFTGIFFNVPIPGGTAPGSPDGLVLNSSDDFAFSAPDGDDSSSSGKDNDHEGMFPARVIVATEEGAIFAYNRSFNPTNAFLVVDNSSSGTVYKGLALGMAPSGRFLYATDFFNGKIDMFDTSFHLTGSFTDPTVPKGYAPFGIENIGGKLYVTFALQKGPDNHDDQKGPGNGYIDVFDTQGNLLQRLVSRGALNSPWGLTLAPERFGRFGGFLLVGNFGDGMINAYDPQTGNYKGALSDTNNVPIFIDGLWGLAFQRFTFRDNRNPNAQGKDTHPPEVNLGVLYFTGGPNDENDGVLGDLMSIEEVDIQASDSPAGH